mgnify:CR=1 FL=1
MQPINQINNNIENGKVIEKDIWMTKLPDELLNVLPEGIWLTLSVDQKKQILRDYGIYDKYIKPEVVSTPVVNNVVNTEINNNESFVITPQTPEIIDINSQKNTQEREVFSSQLEQIKKSEEELENELSKDDKARIEVETAKIANTGGAGSKSVKVFGYTIPMPVISNAQSIASDNPVSDGSTWAAVIVKKIFAIFD